MHWEIQGKEKKKYACVWEKEKTELLIAGTGSFRPIPSIELSSYTSYSRTVVGLFCKTETLLLIVKKQTKTRLGS